MSLLIDTDFNWNPTIWNPSMITTSLWLDAADAATISPSGGPVSQWSDKSGNSRHAVQTTAGSRPGYSSNRITFNGSTFLTCSPGWENYWEWLLVLKFDTTATLQVPIIDNISPSSTAIIGWVASSPDFYRVRNIVSSSNASIASEFGTTTRIHGYSSRTSDTAFAFVDGTQKVSWSTTGGSGMGSTLYFGVNGSLGGNGLQGSICEFILLPTEASVGTRQTLEGYLAHKWGLTANLPAGHPYKTVGPRP